MSRSGSRVFSTYLSTRENGLLVSLVGSDCSTLASAVVQLVLVSPGGKCQRFEWEIHSCGVACLVQDRRVQSAFIRLYSVKRAKLLWEQEVYTSFKYSAPRPYFHCFPGDDCNAGLNFADEEEAEKFLSAVQTYVNSYTIRPQSLLRAQSLDSTSGRILQENRNKSQLDSPTDMPSPASPHSRVVFKFPPDVSHRKPFMKPALFNSSPCPPSTLPRPKKESLPLTIRKGPLPPLPAHASGSEKAQSYSLPLPQWVPPPPSFQAPKAPSNGIVPTNYTHASSRPLTGRDAFSMVKHLNSYHDLH